MKTDTAEIPIARLNMTGARIVLSRSKATFRRLIRRVAVRYAKSKILATARREHNTFKTTPWGWEVSFR